MKNLCKVALAAMLLLPSAPGLSSCSDDSPESPKDDNNKLPDTSPEDDSLEIPDDVLKKVKEIYGKATTGPQTVKTVHQLAILTSICATHPGNGPISVTPAVLNNEEVTLITLGGTEEVEGQATTLEESKLAAFGKENDYLKAVANLFTDGTVPQDKPVLITGISLGGMIAQQILGREDIMKQFDICAVVTFGSPLTLPLDRKGVKVVRFADEHDKVPTLGELLLRNGLVTGSFFDRKELNQKLDELDGKEKIMATSKYTAMIETHALSYIEDACWEKTDFLGSTDKSNVLVLKEAMKFYQAPKQ